MPLRTDLLEPIEGPNPAGEDVTYDLILDELQEARREDIDVPQGDWERPLKRADHAKAVKLAQDILATRSKDLAVAAWLTESNLYQEGIGGLKEGLSLVQNLLETFWDHVYPEAEGEDLELRAGPLNWLGAKLEMPIKRQALNKKGHDFFQYMDSQLIPTEEAATGDSAAMERREAAITEGKLTPEEFDEAFVATPKAWYKELVAHLHGCVEAVDSLDTFGNERFGSFDAPSYRVLRQALEEVSGVAQTFLDEKLRLDPDPIEPDPVPVESEVPGGGAQMTGGQAAAPAGLSPEPTSAADAASRIAGAARYLRRQDPTNPSPYLLLRGFRWGELRTGKRPLDPKLLDAPPTASRKHLKVLLLDGKWAELLDASEEIMATPFGRGWMDLQRYALTACGHLGGEYDPLANSLRGELRSLLVDLPELLGMTLMDDTPTANAQTQAWLHAEVIPDGVGDGAVAPASAPAAPALSGSAVLERARSLVKSGNAQQGIQLLMRQADQEKSERARFMSRSEAAAIMVESALKPVALPILRELFEQIGAHNLDEWEAGDVVARPLGLLYRCIEADEYELQQSLYERICRLDPLQAISFDAGAAGAQDADAYQEEYMDEAPAETGQE